MVTGTVTEDKGLDVPPPKDEDPDGTKLLSSPDGLERAAKLLNPLTKLSKDNVDVWIAVYDVAVRRSKQTNVAITFSSSKFLSFCREVSTGCESTQSRSFIGCRTP